jgi:3-dehydroquinate dehydratase-2
MKISIINGPNLNLVGLREPEIYGHNSLNNYLEELVFQFADIEFYFFQSNIEGEIIDEIQKQGFIVDAIIINAGAYTHTSIAIADALKSIPVQHIIEVHLSNVYAREIYRQQSYIAPVCKGVISGFGLTSYKLAIQYLLEIQ